MRAAAGLICLCAFSASPARAQTTLTQDTTWAAGTTVNLTQEVQIAHGVTLTIEPGVIVNGSQPAGLGAISVFGTLNATGTAANKVQLNNVAINQSGNHLAHSQINLSHVNMTGGSFMRAGNAGYGSFALRDSKFSGVDGFYLWYPTDDSFIERNIFENSDGLYLIGGGIYVRNNVFVKSSGGYAISGLTRVAGATPSAVVERNSFSALIVLLLLAPCWLLRTTLEPPMRLSFGR